MPQSKILIDTNAYFRLAQSIRPLLKVEFGDEECQYLGIPVVTDDGDMLALANDFEIRTFRVLDLLKLMLDCEHITMEKVREIAAYLAYTNDKPREYGRDYKKLFGESPPKA